MSRSAAAAMSRVRNEEYEPPKKEAQYDLFKIQLLTKI